ncbi:hypothetical protein N7535_000799 [Penicillium sp. DV-2018c]|nr:hypothetical protein N7535_000799 [Penicillium sp. DV-2018c]
MNGPSISKSTGSSFPTRFWYRYAWPVHGTSGSWLVVDPRAPQLSLQLINWLAAVLFQLVLEATACDRHTGTEESFFRARAETPSPASGSPLTAQSKKGGETYDNIYDRGWVVKHVKDNSEAFRTQITLMFCPSRV